MLPFPEVKENNKIVPARHRPYFLLPGGQSPPSWNASISISNCFASGGPGLRRGRPPPSDCLLLSAGLARTVHIRRI